MHVEYKCFFQQGTAMRDGWGNVTVKHGVRTAVLNTFISKLLWGATDESHQILLVEAGNVLVLNQYVVPGEENIVYLCP